MPIPVISVAQMREWENLTWSTGVTPGSVMRRAGDALARCAERLTCPSARILILAGKGHNGDDAAFAHESLQGRRSELLRVADLDLHLTEIRTRLRESPALIVDGLFGIGLNRRLEGSWPALIDTINQSGIPVLSVDVPSGLNADTGELVPVAVRASHTLTFAAIKRGLITARAGDFVGRLEVAEDIGLTASPFSTELHATKPEDFVAFLPRRPASGHKGTFGHLAILAGSQGYHGAAVLAARGAQRAQPGLITIYTEENVRAPIAAQLQSAMVRAVNDDLSLPDNATAILAGPGLASTTYPERHITAIRRLWKESPVPMIADASALDWIPEGPVPASSIRVITPHPGEAARMLRCTVAEVQRDRPAALRELSQRCGNCHVVLKGQHTLAGQATGPIAVNLSGNPHLAQGGAGDLLAGYLSGLLAQPLVLRHDATRAIQFAVWQHGAAADALFEKRPHFIIEELADELGSVRP